MGKVRQLHSPGDKPVYRNQLVTTGDLEDFKIEVLALIRQLFTELKGQATKKWLKSYEIKKLLAISSGTLQTLRNNGTLPFTKIGGIMYYDSEAIEKVLREKRVPIPQFSNRKH